MSLHYGTPLKQALETTYEPGTLFRVEGVRYAAIQPYANPVTGDGEWYVTDPKLEVFPFEIERSTPCGAWINAPRGKKWIDLRTGHKQWASRTIEEAVRQLAQRRNAQIWILKNQLARAERERNLANSACKGFFDDLGLGPSATETRQ